MQLIIDTYRTQGTIHHAYALEGDKEKILPQIEDFLTHQFDFSINNNPDYWRGDFDAMSIDDGRLLKDLSIRKSFNPSGKKVFVVSTNFITREAQNSLLKIFEEPTPGNHFFIIVPQTDIFLPTLASRLLIIKGEGKAGKSGTLDAERFLSLKIPERLEMIKNYLDEESDERSTKAEAISFLNAIEESLHNKHTLGRKEAMVFETLITSRNYLHDRSSSVKMILEHLALSL
ncbi:MAG TPA: hypothetical protein VJH55_03870 [Candidatus Paceibacterota bacterium]